MTARTTQQAASFVESHALGSHPETSGQAAYAIFADGTFERQKAAVYVALCNADPENQGLTAKQVERTVLGEDARKRLTDLKEDGALFPHPTERRPNPGSGKPAQVWYRKLEYLEDLANRVRAEQLKQAEERRKMQIKVKELADACKEASKAFNALFIASKAAAAAQERLNTAADAFTPKEQATVVDVAPEDFTRSDQDVELEREHDAARTREMERERREKEETKRNSSPVTAETTPQAQAAHPQTEVQFGGMPGMPGMPGAQPTAQPQAQQPTTQPQGQFGGMPGAQPTAQPQTAAQPVAQAQPQQQQQPAGANGQITPDSLQREIMGAMQRTPAIMQHINTVMMPRYCPQGGGIHAIQPERYVTFLDEMRQAEAAINRGEVVQ